MYWLSPLARIFMPGVAKLTDRKTVRVSGMATAPKASFPGWDLMLKKRT
jgi:hypothetical protein